LTLRSSFEAGIDPLANPFTLPHTTCHFIFAAILGSVGYHGNSIGYHGNSVGYRSDFVGYRRSSVGYRRNSIGCHSNSIGYHTWSLSSDRFLLTCYQRSLQPFSVGWALPTNPQLSDRQALWALPTLQFVAYSVTDAA
jgi:hypothetical protein